MIGKGQFGAAVSARQFHRQAISAQPFWHQDISTRPFVFFVILTFLAFDKRFSTIYASVFIALNNYV